MRRLERDFFARPAPEVARDLVGKLLVDASDGLVVRLVEIEAYTQDDPACHAYGRRTARLEPLYGPPGHAYVYFTYGMHWCANVSTGADGTAEGCLLRAAEPLAGLDVIRQRRGHRVADRDLLRGPARLTQAFGLTRDNNGQDLCGGTLYFADDGCRPDVRSGPRVGVIAAADVAWRFVMAGSPWICPYKRHPRAT